MKFMQRTKEKLEKKKEVQETTGQKISDEEGKPEMEVWMTEESVSNCEDMLFGRLSFRGYNPEIEVLMEEKDPLRFKRKQKEKQEFDGEDITVQEMIEQRFQGNEETARTEQVKRKRGQYI
jgi:M-phase phosphoprotein-6